LRATPGLDTKDIESWNVSRLLGEAKRLNIAAKSLVEAATAYERSTVARTLAILAHSEAEQALNRLVKEKAERSCDAVADRLLAAGGDNAAQVRGFVLELDAFSKLEPLLAFSGDPVWFVKVPNSILTLLLTLAMGALGSTILVTVQFLAPLKISSVTGQSADPDGPPLSWFVFRPFLGMIVALAVFIAFRAGQITLSATPGGGDNGINPFVVSFFALIAGLLSEKAIEFLVRSGEKLLGGDVAKQLPQPLYRASGLEAALAADPGKTREALATHMGASPATVDAWVAGREKVSRADAEKIAAWFNKPLSDLFTEEERPAEGD
jgi:hypothetical protein